MAARWWIVTDDHDHRFSTLSGHSAGVRNRDSYNVRTAFHAMLVARERSHFYRK